MTELVVGDFHVDGELNFRYHISEQDFESDIRRSLSQPVVNLNEFETAVPFNGTDDLLTALIDLTYLDEHALCPQHVTNFERDRFLGFLEYLVHPGFVGSQLFFHSLFDCY